LYLRKQEQELKPNHDDPQALAVEEQHTVVGDYPEDADIVVPGCFYNKMWSKVS
jgi:hypothetical protein